MGAAPSCDRSQHQERRQHAQGQYAHLGEATEARLRAGHVPIRGYSSRIRSQGPAKPIPAGPDTTGTPPAPRQRHQPTTDRPPASESLDASARRRHECDGPEHLVWAASAQRAAPSAAYAASSLRVSMQNIVPQHTTRRSRTPHPARAVRQCVGQLPHPPMTTATTRFHLDRTLPTVVATTCAASSTTLSTTRQPRSQRHPSDQL